MATTYYHTLNGMILRETAGGGVRTDCLVDPLGLVIGTSNKNGTVSRTYRYKPYGASLTSSGTGSDPRFRSVGTSGYLQTDRVHSSHYVRARHYGQLEGRWTSADPLPLQYSEFVYSHSSLARLVDPTGLYVASCDDDWAPTTAWTTECGISGRVWYVPFFCNHHPANPACIIYEPGMTGALPNTNYDDDLVYVPTCQCGEVERHVCKYKSHRPPIYGDKNLNAKCGDFITVSKGKCSVRIQIIDRGPAHWTGAHVDLHPDAAAKFYKCLPPGQTYHGCRQFAHISEVTITHA